MESMFSGLDKTALVLPVIAYLMITFNDAGLICKKQILHNEVGLCNNSTGIVQIWHCRQCPPGLGLSVPCGEMYKVGTKINRCVPCKKGLEYSDKNDIRQCEPCRRCLENEVVHGTCETDGDTTSCSCKPGYYRDTSRDCMPCSWCCGDKTNEYKPECNIPQVPPGKQCSLQTVKSCSPTTPPPPTTTPIPPPTTTPIPPPTTTPIPPPTTTPIPPPTTTPIPPPTTTPIPLPTTTHSKTKESLNKSTSINGDTDSNDSENTPKDPKKSGEEPGGGAKSPEKHLVRDILLYVMACAVVVLAFIIVVICYFWKRNSSSSDGDSTDNRSRSSTSISNDENSSAPLLRQNACKQGQSGSTTVDNGKIDLRLNGTCTVIYSKKEAQALEKVNKQAEPSSEMNEDQTDHPNPKQHPPRENDCVRSNPTLEQSPSTTAQGSQPSMDYEDESARKKEREQQRELIHKTYGPLVEEIPHSVKHKVGLKLNFEQKAIGNDYRMVAEKFVNFDNDQINNLSRLEDPMKEVFISMGGLAKHVDELVDLLFKIGRDDVVQKMYDMALDESQ